MPNYDLMVLYPDEFEGISRDLLQKHWGCYIESFTPGRDKGIDLRCAAANNGTTILQAKRYKDYPSLLAKLKGEVKKVRELNPERYCITTSVGLTPTNKDEIMSLFHPYIKDPQDIFGKTEINNLLGLYPEVEKQYYKLWLSSTPVLENILHKAVVSWSEIELQEIKDNISTYVSNESFGNALKILNEHNYVIISGVPGIGKTTLARMLIYNLLSKDYEKFTLITDDFNQAINMLEKEKKQVFFFDDFLGQSMFEDGGTSFAKKFILFIKAIKKDSKKKLILTTREYILSEARQHYERIDSENIQIAKCTLDVGQYTDRIKAKILYNHISKAQLPEPYIDEFLKGRRYRKIINHRNYNPRIIETLIDNGLWCHIPAGQFMDRFVELLDKPSMVWEMAYEKLSREARYAMLVLVMMGEKVLLSDWEKAYRHFCIKSYGQLNLTYEDCKFKKTVKILHDCFIKTYKSADNLVATPYNPSVRDYLINYICENPDTQRLLIEHSYFAQQILYALTEPHLVSHSYSYFLPTEGPVFDSNRDVLANRFLEIMEDDIIPSCALTISFGEERKYLGEKKEAYTKSQFVKNFSINFPQTFRSTAPGILNLLKEIILDQSEDFSNRVKILRAMRSLIPAELPSLLKQLSAEEILIDEYPEFLDLLKDTSNQKIIEEDNFLERLEETMIVDMDTNISNFEELEESSRLYTEIAEKMPDGISLDRAMYHLEEIEEYYPEEEKEENESDDRDYFGGSYDSDATFIDNMMQTLRI